MKFQYTALTGDNKKITGVFDVESQEAAQAELHKMGVAIISVNEISDADYERLKAEQAAIKEKKGILTFTFLAIDPNRKEIEGTIDALDNFSAYKRLRTEYQFKINELYPSEATEEEKAAAKGMLEGFEAQLEQEQAQIAEEKGEEKAMEGGEGAVNKEIVAEVDKVIISTKKVLEVHQDFYSRELIQEINNILGELERIRTSNNIKHITEVSNDLYTLISNPDKLEEKEAAEAHQQLMEEIKDSALVRREFELYQKAIQASGLKKIIQNITKRLKKITATSEEDGEKPGFFAKLKHKIHGTLETLTKKKMKMKKPAKKKGRIGVLADKLGAYFKTASPVLRKTRKRELIRAFKTLFGMREEPAKKEEAPAPKPAKPVPIKAEKKVKGKRDFTPLFVEIDSFIGWLLMFYIIYFFLVGFALEKNVGLSREFVFKTLKTPLLLNITIFLLLVHFMLRFKNLHLRQNFLATFFLIALTLGLYTLLMVNF